MKVSFSDLGLYEIFTGEYKGKLPFSKEVESKFIDKINVFLASGSINELSMLRSLNIEKYKKHWSARVDLKYRIEFELEKPDHIIIKKISKHYE